MQIDEALIALGLAAGIAAVAWPIWRLLWSLM